MPRTPHGTAWAALPLALGLISLVAAATGHPFVATAAVLGALSTAIVLILTLRPQTRRFAPVVTPVVVAIGFTVFALSDRGAIASASRGDAGFVDRSAILTGVGLLALVLIAAGVDVVSWVGRGVSLAVRALSALAGATMFALIIVPGWIWSRVRPGALLGRRRPPTPVWTSVATGNVDARSPGSAPVVATHRSLVGRVTWALGCVVLILMVNYGLGLVWDTAATRGDEADAPSDQIPGLSQRISRDPRIDSPAMADAPWRARYFADLQRTPGTYWPFTESRPLPFESPYINVEGWSRRTYQAPEADPQAPVLWMFGGSTTFGEGQRDLYTIASWLARLAEQAGTPVRVENFGQRGWTLFQETILYEQLLAAEPDVAPDFALFYDGANEITTQSLLEEAVPSHTLAATYAERLTGGIATELVQEPPPEDVAGDIWHAYSRHSLAHKVIRQLQPSPAGAGEPPDDPDDPRFTPGQETDPDGGVYDYQLTDQDGTDAGRVYERGKRLTQTLSEQYDVTPFFFWQPVAYAGGPVDNAVDELSDSTIDLSRLLLDHQDLFIDGGHTSEEGARLVAEELWATVEPTIVDWYGSR